MKKYILSVSTLLLTIWQITTFAATGIYASIESGWADQVSLPSKAKVQANNIQENNFPVARLGIGYIHDFNHIFGIGFEAGTGYYGKNTYSFNDGTKVNIKTTAIDFFFVAITHWQKVDLFGKLGGNRNTTTGIKKSNDDNDDESTIQPAVALGLNYNFTSHFAATVSYMHYFGEPINDFSDRGWKCPSLNAVLGGLRITFW